MRETTRAGTGIGGAAVRLALLSLAGVLALLAGLTAGCTSQPPPASAATGGATTTTEVQPDAAAQPQPGRVRLAVVPADKAAQVSPGEPVKVTATDGTIANVTLTNSAGKAVRGELSADGRTWTSTEQLGYGKTYTLAASATGANGSSASATSTFSTVKPRTQTFAAVNPLDGQVVGIGQPLAVYFDEPIKNKDAAQQAITVQTTPAVEGAFYWFNDKEVHWRPQHYWVPGTKVVADIKIYGKDLGNGVYGQEDRRITFSIGDAFVAEADGATHQMSVKINGSVVKTMPVSLGKPAVPSHNGVHVVTELHPTKIMDSSTYGVPVNSADGYRTKVNWAVRISNSGEFVHSAPWSVGDQGRRNVSHGCINASPANAKWFFDNVKKGDIVIVTNSGGPPLQAYDGFGDWQLSWSEWLTGGKK
jgi:lipoprotein-anchoring transpeptidase ErfK/SrfK